MHKREDTPWRWSQSLQNPAFSLSIAWCHHFPHLCIHRVERNRSAAIRDGIWQAARRMAGGSSIGEADGSKRSAVRRERECESSGVAVHGGDVVARGEEGIALRLKEKNVEGHWRGYNSGRYKTSSQGEGMFSYDINQCMPCHAVV